MTVFDTARAAVPSIPALLALLEAGHAAALEQDARRYLQQSGDVLAHRLNLSTALRQLRWLDEAPTYLRARWIHVIR